MISAYASGCGGHPAGGPRSAETSRSDESVVYQRAFPLAPGTYLVRLQANDVHSVRGFRMTDSLTVPAYHAGAATLSTPLLVYQATRRPSRDVMPAFILNPRHTVPFGGESPVLYVEAYDDATTVAVQVVNEDSAVVWQGSAQFEASDGDVRVAILTIPADTLPLGRFSVRVGAHTGITLATPLVLTISDQWMVANFEDVLQFIRFIAHDEELDSLRSGSPTDRRRHWEEFWARRDPLPIAGINEYREQFFQRVRIASDLFRESGRAGWQTHRGEVFIVLGPPDQSIDRYLGRTDMSVRPNAMEWVYSNLSSGRLNLLFHDRSGFGRYELIPSSAAAFRSAAERMKPRLPLN
jgi:GWxTD domain-containing protein